MIDEIAKQYYPRDMQVLFIKPIQRLNLDQKNILLTESSNLGPEEEQFKIW